MWLFIHVLILVKNRKSPQIYHASLAHILAEICMVTRVCGSTRPYLQELYGLVHFGSFALTRAGFPNAIPMQSLSNECLNKDIYGWDIWTSWKAHHNDLALWFSTVGFCVYQAMRFTLCCDLLYMWFGIERSMESNSERYWLNRSVRDTTKLNNVRMVYMVLLEYGTTKAVVAFIVDTDICTFWISIYYTINWWSHANSAHIPTLTFVLMIPLSQSWLSFTSILRPLHG